MSSVSASDRSNQSDEIRRIREDYESKEAEDTKKKNKEIRSLNKKQDEELTKIRDQYSEQLEKIRAKHGEDIDDRDKRHTEDIAKIRELYVDSLRRKSVDEARDKEAFKESYEEDMKKEKQIAAQQKEVAERGFKLSLAERDRLMEDRQTRSVLASQAGLTDRTDRLNEKQEKERQSLVEDRDRKVGDLQREVQVMKTAYSDRDSKAEREHRAADDRRTAAFETIYRNQEHNNSELVANRDEVMKISREHNNQVYNEKIQEQTDKMTAQREQYAAEMEGRTSHMIKEAQSEAMRAKNDQTLQAITNRRLRDLDHDHLVNAYQARENDLNRQKEQVFEVVNEKADERVNTVINRSDKLVAESNKRNRMNQNIQDIRHREAIAQQETLSKDQLAQANLQTDKRVRKIMQSSNLAQANQIRRNDENVDDLRTNYSEHLQTQREAQLESMKDIYSRMDQKLRDLEAHLSKKHDDAVEYYEGRIDELENQHKKDMLSMNKNFEVRTNQREKAVKMEEDTLTQKYEQKMAIQDDLHQKELNRLEKRHQEQIQSVASRSAAAQKKA